LKTWILLYQFSGFEIPQMQGVEQRFSQAYSYYGEKTGRLCNAVVENFRPLCTNDLIA
jgi:hypothetical protein